MTENAKRPITATTLAALRLPGTPTLDPQGTRAVFVVAEPDLAKSEVRMQLHLAVEAADAPPATRQLTFGLDDATQPQWSPDGTHIGFITFRPQPHEDEEDDQREDGLDKRQVFLLPADGGEARRLTDAAEGVEHFRWWPDGSGVVVLAQAPRPAAEEGWRQRRKDTHDDAIVVHGDMPEWELWRYPLEGRPKRLLGGVRDISDFDISPDGKWLAYATNHTGRSEDHDKTEILLRALETGVERVATRGRGGGEEAPRFSGDGRFLFFLGGNDPGYGFSRQDLFALDLTAPEAAPFAPLASLDRDVDEYLPLPDGRVIALLAHGFHARAVVADPRGGAPAVVPLEGRLLSGLTCAKGTGRIVLIAEDGTTAPEVGFLDVVSGTFAPLTDLNPDARDWDYAPRRVVRWSSEGFDHEGLLLLPPRPVGDGPPPVLVWAHGGPHWRAVDALRSPEAEPLAASGWAVFLPQFRGSSGYDERYTLANRNDLGGADARDVLAGLAEIGRLGLVDTGRAAIGGASYGGYLTNWLLATSDAFRAGVSMCGIFDLTHDFSTSSYPGWELHYLGGPPWRAPDLYRDRSPLRHVDTLTAPLLILHGIDDDNTPLTNSKALYRALQTLGRTTELVVYPREGHGFQEPQHRIDTTERITRWLELHVLGVGTRHVTGLDVGADGVRMTLLHHALRHEYGGVRAASGMTFLEVALLLRAAESGPEQLRFIPSGTSADVVLIDETEALFRPIGVPLDVHGQVALFAARGAVDAWKGEDGRPASLAVAVVFEVPEAEARYKLQVRGLPPVTFDIAPEPDDEDDPAPAHA